MTFTEDLARFMAKTEAKAKAVFVNSASAVQQSIVHGSPITGSPGQPVDFGTLRDSWSPPLFDSPTSATISTNLEYAPSIEDNLRGARLRSSVGGFHSVRLTVGAFERLVDAETRKVTGGS